MAVNEVLNLVIIQDRHWKYLMILSAIMLMIISPGVHAAVTVSNLYVAPSEADLYYGATDPECQHMNISCSDTDYPSISTVFSEFGDANTASGGTVRDSDNTQSTFARLIYDLDGLLSGNYSIRFSTASTTFFHGAVCAYINDTHVNTSSCIYFNSTLGETWQEVVIDSIVRESAYRYNNRVILRFYVTHGYSKVITEMYLKRPFTLVDFSVDAQGVSETDINERVENSWTVYSVSGTEASVTIPSCTVNEVQNTSAGIDTIQVNSSYINISYEITENGFSVFWDAQEPYIKEGKNYEVDCDMKVNGVQLQQIRQFVYVNRERTLFQKIQQIITYLLQIIGIVHENQVLINETKDIANETLQAVLNLEGAVRLEPQTINSYVGDSVTAMAFLTVAQVPSNNASCSLTVYYPNATKWLDEVNMTAVGADGIYKYDITFPAVTGNYQALTYCTGGGLSASGTRASSTWSITDGVMMRAIS